MATTPTTHATVAPTVATASTASLRSRTAEVTAGQPTARGDPRDAQHPREPDGAVGTGWARHKDGASSSCDGPADVPSPVGRSGVVTGARAVPR